MSKRSQKRQKTQESLRPQPLSAEDAARTEALRAEICDRVARMAFKPAPQIAPPPEPVVPVVPEPRPMTWRDFHDWRRRTAAELIALPRMCPSQRCRRRGLCVAREMPCLTAYRRLAAHRFNHMLGWAACELEDDDELRW